MPRTNYYDLLKHPKWQRKRLEVMQRQGFACEDCGDTETTLNVHHSYYEKGLKPWEYPDESLHCLCEPCHQTNQDWLTLLHRQIGRVGLVDVHKLLGYAIGLETMNDPCVVIDLPSYEASVGVADVYHLTPEEVIRALRERSIDGETLLAMNQAKNHLTRKD